MKKLSLLILSLLFCVLIAKAQDDEDEGLQISGSVDTYWKYDFSGNKAGNIATSFADNQNSISIGMIDLVLAQTVGKASFVGELAFGPRSFKSIPLFETGDEDDIYVGIQNLYVSYAFSDLFSMTAGYMGTFVGYEVISPAGNYNYSTSYLFSAGPFQNSGIKADFTISDRFAFMVGLFNDWNVYQDFTGVTDFGAQVYFAPVDGWDIYVNYVGGGETGNIFDITTGWQISDAFYLGLNAANFVSKSALDDVPDYSGIALYPQYAFSDAISLGLRYEYFNRGEYQDLSSDMPQVVTKDNMNSVTLTANLKAGPLTLIPEFRMDTWDEQEPFFKNEGNTEFSKSASQFLIAAVYAF